MINETLEADRAYQRDKDDAYNRGYAQGYKDAKAEQPERIKGRWKAVRVNPRMIRCSNCNNGWWNKELIKALKFCPNCGAEMEVTA